jgi:crotonobetainyl-CoA:carnitine CoA-transferase CaiB-like acyl-CoA transferase
VSGDGPPELLSTILAGLGDAAPVSVEVTGAGTLPSAFRVSDLAVSSIAAAGVELARLTSPDAPPAVTVDRGLAAHWFHLSIRPDGWTVPPIWDAVAGDYRTSDGWIRLHTNAPHHRAAALTVLDVPAERAAVESAVAHWSGDVLEAAVVEAGGAAAAMRSIAQWALHPQGARVSAEPLLAVEPTSAAPAEPMSPPADRPLTGVRVLDLTRVLAGPVATRLLAGWGATVLRIDPPDWDEPAVIPEMLLGKRTARLDLRSADGRDRFTTLLGKADVVVSGYRSDALERLGLGDAARAALRPGLVDVALDAYGWTGPWRARRGFDSLVQMSAGIAHAGMIASDAERPTPLPVQALDHATGYLMAAAALRGLAVRRASGRGSRWRLSLARTAQLLIDAGSQAPGHPPGEAAVSDAVEQTSWGPARRVRPPLSVGGAALCWELPARALGSDAPSWPKTTGDLAG